MKNKMFDVVHNARDRLDFAELVCDLIICAIYGDAKDYGIDSYRFNNYSIDDSGIDDILNIPNSKKRDIPYIVRKLGRNIATLAESPRLPIKDDLQYPDVINGVFRRIIRKRISKKDSVEKLLTLVSEIGWAIDNVSDEQIEQAINFYRCGKDREALNAVKPVQQK